MSFFRLTVSLLVLFVVSSLVAPVWGQGVAARPAEAGKAPQQKDEALASIAILPYADKSGTENFGYLPGSLVDAIDSSMSEGFTYRRLSPEEVAKVLESDPDLDTSSPAAVGMISKELGADIIIFGSFTYNESDKNVTITTNIFFPGIGEVANLPPVTNPVDSTLFQVTDKVAAQIIEQIHAIVTAHAERSDQKDDEEDHPGKQAVTVAALEKHGQHWSLGVEAAVAWGGTFPQDFSGKPQVLFFAIPVEKKIGKNISIYNASGAGFFMDRSPSPLVLKFPLLAPLSLPFFIFFPNELIPLIDGLAFHINFLNGGSMNPYIGLPVYVVINDSSEVLADIAVEGGLKTKFNLGPNNFFFMNVGVSYPLLAPLSGGTLPGLSPILHLSLGWSYLFR